MRIAVYALLLGLSGLMYLALGSNWNHRAEKEAALWAAEHVPNYQYVYCMNTDTEGYVTCMVLRSSANPVGLECASSLWRRNKGCRIPQSKPHDID